MALYTVSMNDPVGGGSTTLTLRSFSDVQNAISAQNAMWGRFQAAAKQDLENQMSSTPADTGWTTYGSKITGTTPPSVPAEENITLTIATVCGARSSQSILTGDVTIGTKFFSSVSGKVDKQVEYRLKEIRPYIAPGLTLYGFTTNSAIDSLEYSKAVGDLSSVSISSFPSGPGIFYATQVNNPMILETEAALKARGNTYVYSYDPEDIRNKWSYNSNLGAMSYVYTASGMSYAFLYSSYSSPGQAGEWEIETRTTYINQRTEPGSLCKTSSYVLTTLDKWEDMGGGGSGLPGPITVSLGSLVNPRPAFDKDGIVYIGNICGTGFHSSAYNPYNPPNFMPDTIAGYNKKGTYHPAVELTYTTPGANFLVQSGSPFSSYSETQGMYVLDLYYKKWGKCKETFSSLIDLTPLNIPSPSSLGTTNIGMNAAVFKTNKIRLFDTEPAESMIRYGKIGYVRLGVTHLLEEHLHFKRDFYGSVTIEPSLDGRNIDLATIHTNTFFGTKHAILYPNIRYKWHNVVITGVYDMQYLETRGNISGRR